MTSGHDFPKLAPVPARQERQFGEVSEWLKEHAWKVCIRQRIGGSNPPLTAIFKEELVRKCELFFSHFICLYGSEHGGRVEYVTSEFLSCLYGSERQLSQPLQDCSFLSCLYGSELKYYTFSPLLIKQNHLIFLLSPFFILTFSSSTNYQQLTFTSKNRVFTVPPHK